MVYYFFKQRISLLIHTPGSDLDIGSVSESEDVPGNEEELTSMSEEENESFQHKPGRIKARFIPTSQRLPLRQPTPVESVTITSKVEEESVTGSYGSFCIKDVLIRIPEPDTDEDAPASGPSPAVKPHSPTIPLAEESVTGILICHAPVFLELFTNAIHRT